MGKPTKAVAPAKTGTVDVQQTNVAALLGVPPNATEAELLDLGVSNFNSAGLQMARAGACFLELKGRTQHAFFEKSLTERGIEIRHAQNAMQLARFIGGLPEADAARMLKVPYTKALAISRADPEVIADLLDDGALDGAEPLTVREIRQRVRDAEQRAVDAEAREKAAKLEARKLADQFGDHTSAIGKEAAALRDQGLHLTERMTHSAKLLAEQVVAALINHSDRDATARIDASVAATLVYHTLNAVIVDLAVAAAQLEDTFGAKITGGIEPSHQYQPSEAPRLRALRESALTAADKDFRTAKAKAQKEHKLVGRHSR